MESQIFFLFTVVPGEMLQFDEHIFQMGWNHQFCLITMKRSNKSFMYVVDGYVMYRACIYCMPVLHILFMYIVCTYTLRIVVNIWICCDLSLHL